MLGGMDVAGHLYPSAFPRARVVTARNAPHPLTTRLSFGSLFQEPREQSRRLRGGMDAAGHPFTPIANNTGYTIGYRHADASRHA